LISGEEATNTYTWNARNQLTKISQGGIAQLTYSYDAMGRRMSKTVGTGTPTQFLYSGPNAVQETQGSTINPILVGLNVDERFARNDTTGRTYFLSDAINSTIALTSTTGAIQNQYSYDPYGNASQSGTGFTNPYQFMAREADTAGLYYYRARYYSPMMTGFISEDPAGFAGGQLSFYAGFGGDPIDFNDPYGLYRAVVVTLPNGAQYMPMTTVKNSAQADSYSVPIGTEVAIAVPDGINPQDMVNDWASTYWNGPAVFAWAWRPGGPNDYKLQNAMYDAYGNFEYGVLSFIQN
jgi:RHS repeat-associated protein